MRRILLLVTVASMLAAAIALSGLVQAKPTIEDPADAKCLAEAAKTVEQPGFNPSNYTFHGGTELNDDFTSSATADPDVFCGFGGDDRIATLGAGDIFLGGENGAGFDLVVENNGTVYGGAGIDEVRLNNGTFYGGEGIDLVAENSAGATFYGEEGNDEVSINYGTFYGEEGDDQIDQRNYGTFYGEEGDDEVVVNVAGATFYGGPGNDEVGENNGTFYGGEGCDRVAVGTPPADGPEGPCTI